MTSVVDDYQLQHWNSVYAKDPEKFGCAPSAAAHSASKAFQEHNVVRILELGCGPGRDATFFARQGLHVTALDYASTAVETVNAGAVRLGLADRLTAIRHDLRSPMPLDCGAFDACYSHMALCMELRDAELVRLFAEIRRVLKPGGLHFYTVRTTEDPDYRSGIHRGEDIFEVDGYVIHFFNLQTIVRLSEGYRVIGLGRFEEGSKQLFSVMMQTLG